MTLSIPLATIPKGQHATQLKGKSSQKGSMAHGVSQLSGADDATNVEHDQQTQLTLPEL